MKIGLYFGSFNPIHHGHLIIANFILQNSDLAQVWLVISPQNPFKPNHGLLNEYHRLALVNTALEGETKIRASDIEFRLPKPSYTIDTLSYLHEKYPEHEFVIIMGSDSYQNLDKWKNAAVIMDRYPIYVYTRPGFPVRKDLPAKITVLKAPMLQISATEVRTMIQKGQSIRYLVPDSVKEEIERNSYYKQLKNPAQEQAQ
jgi:nicotinate-nucleotide adenylyltransferase